MLAPSSTQVLKKPHKHIMEFDLENPLTDFHEPHSDTITSLFLVESDHMPSENYFQSLQAKGLDISVRREAISEISKVLILAFVSACSPFSLQFSIVETRRGRQIVTTLFLRTKSICLFGFYDNLFFVHNGLYLFVSSSSVTTSIRCYRTLPSIILIDSCLAKECW